MSSTGATRRRGRTRWSSRATSPPSGWDEFFTGDDTLLCALDRLFDKASVFVMRGPSYRGRGLDTYSVEAVPQAVKVRGIQPEGM